MHLRLLLEASNYRYTDVTDARTFISFSRRDGSPGYIVEPPERTGEAEREDAREQERRRPMCVVRGDGSLLCNTTAAAAAAVLTIPATAAAVLATPPGLRGAPMCL